MTDICKACQADLSYQVDGKTYTRRIALYDRDLDCTTGHKCPDCGNVEQLSYAEILAMADPEAFDEIK